MKAKTLNGLALLIVFICCGASCPRSRQLVNDYAPTVLPDEPTLEDVIRAVNANSARIQQVQSQDATLDIPGFPTLEADYAMDRPRRFRLRASAGVLGNVLDLGSNDQVYWMWTRHADEPGVFWGRHDAFHQSAARQVLPVPPDWMIEALGVVQLDPTGQHDGPRLTPEGHLEIYSQIPTAAGTINKRTVVDPARGWVLQQHLFDNMQRPLASAMANHFQYDQLTGVSLPRRVEVYLAPIQLGFTLNTRSHQVNQLAGDPQQLWTMPQLPDVPLVDLDDPGFSMRAPPTLMARRAKRSATNRQPPDQQRRASAVLRLGPFRNLR